MYAINKRNTGIVVVVFQNLIRSFCYVCALRHDTYTSRNIISHFKKIFIDTPAFGYLARAHRWYPPSYYLPRTHTVNATYRAIFVAPRCFLIFHLLPSFVSLIRSISKLSASVLQVHRIIAIVVSLAPIFCSTYVSYAPSLFVFFTLSFSPRLTFNRVHGDRRVCVPSVPGKTTETASLGACPACT